MSLDTTDEKSTLVQVMVWQQAIILAIVEPVICCHMPSPGHNELNMFEVNYQPFCCIILYKIINMTLQGLPFLKIITCLNFEFLRSAYISVEIHLPDW